MGNILKSKFLFFIQRVNTSKHTTCLLNATPSIQIREEFPNITNITGTAKF